MNMGENVVALLAAAEEVRELALPVRDTNCRLMMLMVAADYEALAANLATIAEMIAASKRATDWKAAG
jgi:hypothetical protein